MPARPLNVGTLFGGDARVEEDAVSRLLEHLRIAEKMADSIQQLSSMHGAPDKNTLISWSVRAKAALRDAKAIIENEGRAATGSSGGPAAK
jgi:hypothetical protein